MSQEFDVLDWLSYQRWAGQGGAEYPPRQEEGRWNAVEAVLSSLDDSEKDIVLTYFAVLDFREVGYLLGIPKSTVHDTFHRAVAKLKDAAGAYYETGVEPPVEYAADITKAQALHEPEPCIVETYRQTRSVRRTAEACGVSKSTVHRVVSQL